MRKQKNIRNFCIIAHVDHGKSTLADRLLEHTNTVEDRDMKDQLLDNMDIERERGITVKLTPARMHYNYKGEDYILNLIDTPGHVDFTYEVSRSLAACEGALLVVDAAQGVEAQTLTNVYLALDNDLEIIPVINKIDLGAANIDAAKQEIEDIIGLDSSDAILVSAKEGINIDVLLEAIVERLPAPAGDSKAPLRALIFDSIYDNFKGVICNIRVVDGFIKPGMSIKMMSNGKTFECTEVGIFDPNMKAVAALEAGDVGYLTASIKNVQDTAVGDTITTVLDPAETPLKGYKPITPMVYAGVYPADGSRYDDLREAIKKLKLNDAALTYEPESSSTLGFGFRMGFLGLLHMEIIEERLEREFDLDLVTTAPSVIYKVIKTDGSEVVVDSPTKLPDPSIIDSILEPIVDASIYSPPTYVGPVMELCQEKRGTFINMTYLDMSRVKLDYKIPLSEIIYDFFDSLKSRTRGYASLDYTFAEYKADNLVKVDFLLNGDICDALSLIVHKDAAYTRARKIAERLKDAIPRQMFEIPVQAAIGSKIIARETVKAMRKDVLAKCYGGDITRKKKLLEKQKAGKKRMRQFGSVSIPSEAFMSILKINDD
ncbi:MAG TPA: translation elongation factor 4 [Clostridia bacterium]|jgi:GTP-binding protein LepA|nr:translation elongation factor 4 [Clostridia bacterium]